MNKKIAMDQNGRSMIEMLGVLAIVGVLSVAGIAGYSKAMGKYKINKAMDQVATLAANIKTMFAGTGSYSGLSKEGTNVNERAYKLGLFPEEMVKTCTSTFADSCVVNALNGGVTISGAATNFTFAFTGLTKEACTALMTSDWGGSAGFISVTSGGKTITPTTTGNFSLAAQGCTSADDNTVTWVFF